MLAAALALLLWQPADIVLPAPQKSGGASLLQALSQRKSERDFASKPLPKQILSNLLWAAYGINRPASGGRTAPSAYGWQTVDVYVALAEGLYLYDAPQHALHLVSGTDARAIAGTQEFTAIAPLNLVYVANMSKTKKESGDTDDDILSWVSAEAGAVAQNVSLFCASTGLAGVVRAGVQREAFAKAARLRPDQRILLAQTIGYTATAAPPASEPRE